MVSEGGKGLEVVVEEYSLDEYTRVQIVRLPDGSLEYRVIQPELSEKEAILVNDIRRWFIEELSVEDLASPEKVSLMIDSVVRKMAKKRLGKKVSNDVVAKIAYIIKRDILGFGKIDPLLKDPNIEDIHIVGVGRPVFIWHRMYENIPTNIYFFDPEELNRHLHKLMLVSGRFASLSRPIVDGTLPMGYRVHVVHPVVSELGAAITIRKYREVPFTVADLMKFGTVFPELLALLWVAMEHKRSVFIVGETAAGKSFPSYTLLPVKVKGKEMIITAQELYDMVKSREYKVGEHLVKDVDGIEILGLDGDLKAKWLRIKRVIRHKDHRPLVKVRTNSSIIVTTKDHNFVKFNPKTNEILPVKADELRIGDFIVNAWINISVSRRNNSVNPNLAYSLGLKIGEEDYIHSSSNNIHENSLRTMPLINQDTATHVIKNIYGGLRSHMETVVNIENFPRYQDDIIINALFSDEGTCTALLAGILDAKGSLILSGDGKDLTIEFHTKSKDLVNIVSFILKRLRIFHTITEEITHGYKVVVKGKSAKSLLRILSKWSRKVEKYGNISFLTVNRGDGLSCNDNEASSTDGSLGNDLFVERVISIEEVKPSNEWLYDLEVEGTHLFIIGQIGWRLNHNTTLLNAIATLIPTTMKVVVIEEVREIKLPHPNVIYMVTKEGVDRTGKVTLFDLVKASMRQRPDFIIVGEIRGEEAYVLMQAISLGHGGLSTMHAEGPISAVKRLMAPPMNIPPYLVRLLDIIVHISKVRGRSGIRRYVLSATEIEDIDLRTNEPTLRTIYKVSVDTESPEGPIAKLVSFEPEKSLTLKRISDIKGIPLDRLVKSVRSRIEFLRSMMRRKLTYEDVIREITRYSE